ADLAATVSRRGGRWVPGVHASTCTGMPATFGPGLFWRWWPPRGPLTISASMLRRLRIENLVLIHEAELGLAPGLNAITGETGAGKTILAQAFGLLLGAKGDDSYVGAAGEEAYVEAELDLPAELEALGELRPEDEDALLVARRVFADGRTRAYAWG